MSRHRWGKQSGGLDRKRQKQVAGEVADKDKEKWKQFHENDCIASWEASGGSNDSAAATRQ